MNLYERYVLPRLIDLAMRNKAATAERARLIPLAAGIVLEVGIGSGLNLPFYGSAVERLHGVDPRPELWALARGRLERVSFPIEFIQASAEHVPMGDRTVDTVVMTWTLCSIPDARLALLEMQRVLKPEGRLIFIEHGLAPDPRVVAWQDRLNPVWRRVAGGCNLNRKIDSLLLDAGFGSRRASKGTGRAETNVLRIPWRGSFRERRAAARVTGHRRRRRSRLPC